MVKRMRAAIMAVLMATIFPLLRIGGPPGGDPVSEEKPKTPSNEPEKLPDPRIADLEGQLAGKNSRITELETMMADSTARANKVGESLKEAIAGYKALIIAANPDVLPELITGDTIETLALSMAKGKELTGKVRANLESNAQKARIPAGSPPRGPEDMSKLSAREKINRGIKG
jgi:uncharacterized coiled-coil protein SlyX